ncbi:MAG: penicillin acylase family protein [Chloroflexi bacterium]|nr:penicillin acylase family protein [Chloroflexota bacterium]
MKKVGRFLMRGLIAVVILALVLGAGGAFYFKSYLPNTVAKQSFPQIDGEIQITGLEGPVDVYRDSMGIPHIYAASAHDLFFAQGYVHAQDRFWQMDAWRHIGSGTLSEMFGSAQVETDTFLRTLGWRVTAEAEWEALGPDSRAILQAYTDGVNAYLKDHNGTALSLEYAILGLLSPDYKLEPWTPVNSLTWGKAMAWDLRGNMDEEITRAVLLKTLTPEQVDQLYPPYPEDHPVIVNKIGDGAAISAVPAAPTDPALLSALPLDSVQSNIALLDPLLGQLSDGIGSNSWAVSGKLTDTGMPILANDPHLGIQMPSIWYQVDMHCMPKSDACPFEMAGFSFAGVPGVVIGHNDRIAWGFTNTGPDVMDLFIEKVNPDNPNQYEVDGKWVDFETRKETVAVVGGEPVEVTVRLTRHGPVISDAYGPLKDQGDPKDKEFVPFKERTGIELPQQYVIALQWTALTPSTPFEAIWGFDKAQNWTEFRAAASNFHVPAQNLLYADVDGNIGYQMPGDVPIRKKGDGRFPVPGWNSEYDWTGYIPFEEQPYTFNPTEGYIVTANNQVPPRDYPYMVTSDWDYGFRANRILEMIQNAPGKIDIAYIQKMHGDAFDASAAAILPIWSEINYKAASPNEAYALDLMQKWDDQSTADSKAAAVYQQFWWNLDQNTFNDDLPERYAVSGGDKDFEVMRRLVQTPNDPFWDDRSTTDKVETRDDIFIASLVETVNQLEKDHGKDPAQWPTWGDLHTATFRNQTLGESGISLIEDLFNRGPFPTGGGKSIVNATGWSIGESFEVDWLPSMRMIVDLGNLNNSLTVHTTGQSGHAYSEHYADMAPLWASVQYYPMWWDQQSAIKDAEGHLVLKP